MAADKSDDPGVLGNLPRSRPGHRSDKRGSSAAPARKAPAATGKASATGRGAGAARKASTAASGKTRAGSPRRARPAPRSSPTAPTPPTLTKRPREPDPRSPDPLTGAVRLAGKVAEAGISTAGGILRRLTGR